MPFGYVAAAAGLVSIGSTVYHDVAGSSTPTGVSGSTSDPINHQYYAGQLSNLISNPSSVTSTPDYQFNLQQGQQAIQGSAAANGMLHSGNTLSALDQYGQGLASQTYQQQVANLSSLATGNPQYGALGLAAQQQSYNQSATSANSLLNIGQSLGQAYNSYQQAGGLNGLFGGGSGSGYAGGLGGGSGYDLSGSALQYDSSGGLFGGALGGAYSGG